MVDQACKARGVEQDPDQKTRIPQPYRVRASSGLGSRNWGLAFGERLGSRVQGFHLRVSDFRAFELGVQAFRGGLGIRDLGPRAFIVHQDGLVGLIIPINPINGLLRDYGCRGVAESGGLEG